MDDQAGLCTSQLLHVLEVSRLLAAAADLESLLPKIAAAACGLLNCERASIWLHDPKTDELFTTVLLHCDGGQIRISARTGIVGAAFNSNCIVNVPDAYGDSRFNSTSDRVTGFLTRSLVACPMLNIEGQPKGVIEAVNKVDAAFSNRDQQLLQLLADQAGVAIQRKQLQQVALHAAAIQKEIQLARRVQQSMLPKVLPLLPGYDIAAWSRPASTIGGDCYDLWHMTDGRVGILLADASGHGLAPALVVSQVRTMVRTLCDASATACHPHEVLRRVNQRLASELDHYRFVTAFLGFLDGSGSVEWQSAGQGPILFRPYANGPIEVLNPPIPPLNAMDEWPEDPPPRLQIHPGGSIAFISDGIFEAFDSNHQIFGMDRVITLLENNRQLPASTLIETMISTVSDWQQDRPQADDQTIVMVKA